MRKKTVWVGLLLLGVFLMGACSDNGEPQARQHLQKAEQAL